MMIPSHCIPKGSCNTESPLWIHGDHPSEKYQLVSRSACLHNSSNCCAAVYSVQIRNCGDFYVYQLRTPDFCHQRYCSVSGKAYDFTFDFSAWIFLLLSLLFNELFIIFVYIIASVCELLTFLLKNFRSLR